MLRHLLPRLRDFVFIVVFTGALLSGTRMINTDSDLGRHLALGNYMLNSHQIPTRDILSYTKAGEPRPPYEWLSELAFAAVYRVANLDGVVLLSALLIAAAFAIVFSDAVHRSAAPMVALFLTFCAAAASSLHWVARPHLFTFVFFAIWLAMLQRVRREEHQPLWHFPLLMLLWANAHGGFLFGFLAYAAYAAGWMLEAWQGKTNWEMGRKFAMIGGASVAASIATPDLWGNWTATLNNRSGFILGHTVETMPLNLLAFNSWPFLALVALSIMLMVLQRRTLVPAHAILLAGLAVSCVAMARNVPLFAIAAAPLCAYWLAQSLARVQAWSQVEAAFSSIDRGLRGFLWSGIAVVAASGIFLVHLHEARNTIFQWSSRTFPIGAATWVQQNAPAGQLFNDINWGGYLMFRLWPRQRVFIDSQTDFYGEAFVREYAGLLDAPDGWEANLAKYNVAYLVLPPSTPLVMEARQAGWQAAYQDATAVVLFRR